MLADDIANCLVQQNCKDITPDLDFERCNSDSLVQGGFGMVYKGFFRGGQAVAIKCIATSGNWGNWKLEEKSLKRTAHELYAWSKCNHPGILKMLGFARFEEHILLVSPWMKNGSLVHYIETHPKFNRLELSVELTSALSYLHGEGIVHGDIKADNVIMSDNGHVQLGDFGSAILLEYTSVNFTQTGFKGSIRFTAPELMGKVGNKPTVKSDIYALGMTILQIMTGEPPFAAMQELQIPIAVVVKKIKPDRPNLSRVLGSLAAENGLWRLLTWCWSYQPDERPTGADVETALGELVHQMNKLAITRPVPSPARVRPRPPTLRKSRMVPLNAFKSRSDHSRSLGPAKRAFLRGTLPPRTRVKKALIIGINYEGLPEDKRLCYAVRDAELWHATLLRKGVSAENARIVTDGKAGGELPTCDVLIKHIRWLVQGAVPRDSLFFVYSGHAVRTQFGPSIVTADQGRLYRPLLEKELVMAVPAGVDLQVVFDCSHSAGMIGLQYCVGRMDKPTPQADSHGETSSACPPESELSEPLESTQLMAMAPPRSSSLYPHALQRGSLHGLPMNTDTTSGVVEGARMPDYFEERAQGFLRPAGKVMVWAGTGETQNAFESYGNARQGVVTKAMCAALRPVATRRDLWSYLVQEIESENDKRTKRDASKAINGQPVRAMRIQHAQLWVSRLKSHEPLLSAAPALDQPIL